MIRLCQCCKATFKLTTPIREDLVFGLAACRISENCFPAAEESTCRLSTWKRLLYVLLLFLPSGEYLRLCSEGGVFVYKSGQMHLNLH